MECCRCCCRCFCFVSFQSSQQHLTVNSPQSRGQPIAERMRDATLHLDPFLFIRAFNLIQVNKKRSFLSRYQMFNAAFLRSVS